jgi:hypothetical protein
VRRRCYTRWVADGKLSQVDATDRLERLEKALDICERAVLLEAAAADVKTWVGVGKSPELGTCPDRAQVV